MRVNWPAMDRRVLGAIWVKWRNDCRVRGTLACQVRVHRGLSTGLTRSKNARSGHTAYIGPPLLQFGNDAEDAPLRGARELLKTVE